MFIDPMKDLEVDDPPSPVSSQLIIFYFSLARFKPGFHMIATIAVIAEKKKVQRSYGNHFPAIAAIVVLG